MKILKLHVTTNGQNTENFRKGTLAASRYGGTWDTSKH